MNMLWVTALLTVQLFAGSSYGTILDGLPDKLKTDNWVTIDEVGSQFHPLTPEDYQNRPIADADTNALRSLQGRFLGGTSSFERTTADAYGTYYDGYSQAWRYLGFYIDCGEDDDDDGHRRRTQRKRKLEGDDDEEGGCKRILLWAAYVDVEYQGGGIGEYQFWDSEINEWDTTPCNMTESPRCAKMDCHLDDTHFQLLGYFKEENYLEWMEQLFKHEGYCVWDENSYEFMQTYYYSWPEECVQSKTTVGNGYLYVDLQPTSQGGMSLGLYTDSRCRIEYEGRSPTIASVIYDYYGNNESPYDIIDQLDNWNKAMDLYKTCQPCRAYQLGYKYDDDDRRNKKRKHRKLNSDDGDADFDCEDDAGYENVNQCMKFATHTNMRAATFRDMSLASQQRFMIGTRVAGVAYGEQLVKQKENYTFLFYSLGIFALAALMFWATVATHQRSRSKKMSEPFLTPSASGVQA